MKDLPSKVLESRHCYEYTQLLTGLLPRKVFEDTYGESLLVGDRAGFYSFFWKTHFARAYL